MRELLRALKRRVIQRRPAVAWPRVIVSSGGMGSSHAANAVRAAGVRCIEKPFVNTLYCADWPEPIRRQDRERRPTVASLDDLATDAIRRRFRRVQILHSDFFPSFALRTGRTLAENFEAYLAHLARRGHACVVRGTSVAGRLAGWKPRQPVFLVRHPLQSYVSYAKPERHLRDIDALGGLGAPAAIDFWAWSWNTLVAEYASCVDAGLEPVLVRYETVAADTEHSPDPILRAVFSSFRPHTNRIDLPDATVRRMRDAVTPAYFSIYDRWELD